MKPMIRIVIILAFFMITLPACKKDSKPADEDKVTALEDGRYIIRTKYFCNGGCFVFRFVSNHEAIQWEWIAPETLEDIKKDKSLYNPYLWSIIHTGSLGDLFYIDDGNTIKLINPRPYYTIYQPLPDGNTYSYLPADVFPDGYTDDAAGTGSPSKYVAMEHTDVSPLTNAFDHDLSRTFIVGVSDSTYRISLQNHQSILHTFFSLITKPNGADCEEALLQPVWRDTWLCPNTTSVNSGWYVDACYTSQVVLEKVD
ncbi:MAG: hypothetical protein QM594_04930 [Niabella sp.]